MVLNQSFHEKYELLEKLYKKYSKKKYYENDPIHFPHRYKTPEDIEIIGFIAAVFAYGRVNQFTKIIEQITDKMGESPREYIENYKLEEASRSFDGLYYRFNSSVDIVALLYGISKTVKKWGSLKNLFYQRMDRKGNIKEAIICFIEEIRNNITLDGYFKEKKLQLKTDYLLISPEKNSACKRMNMFLRWMVRDKDIDFGIWPKIGKENLVMPIDTHVSRISRCLGLLKRKNNDWQAAEELTKSLRKFDAKDPVKYDFALCHIGIDGVCSDRNCDNCKIKYAL